VSLSLICHSEKQYPSKEITKGNTNYLSFAFPHPATNIGYILKNHSNNMFKLKSYEALNINNEKIIKNNKKQRILKGFKYAGIITGAILSGFTAGYLYRFFSSR
jgi:hypothetical protein